MVISEKNSPSVYLPESWIALEISSVFLLVHFRSEMPQELSPPLSPECSSGCDHSEIPILASSSSLLTYSGFPGMAYHYSEVLWSFSEWSLTLSVFPMDSDSKVRKRVPGLMKERERAALISSGQKALKQPSCVKRWVLSVCLPLCSNYGCQFRWLCRL